VLALAALAILAAWLSATASQEKKKQETKQAEPKKEESKTPAAASGGLFTSFRKADAKGEQTQATASAGAKGAKPFGKAASGAPSTAARAKLLDMEEEKPKADDLAAFVKEGNLGGKQ
jgi:hypothetical protein